MPGGRSLLFRRHLGKLPVIYFVIVFGIGSFQFLVFRVLMGPVIRVLVSADFFPVVRKLSAPLAFGVSVDVEARIKADLIRRREFGTGRIPCSLRDRRFQGSGTGFFCFNSIFRSKSLRFPDGLFS